MGPLHCTAASLCCKSCRAAMWFHTDRARAGTDTFLKTLLDHCCIGKQWLALLDTATNLQITHCSGKQWQAGWNEERAERSSAKEPDTTEPSTWNYTFMTTDISSCCSGNQWQAVLDTANNLPRHVHTHQASAGVLQECCKSVAHNRCKRICHSPAESKAMQGHVHTVKSPDKNV